MILIDLNERAFNRARRGVRVVLANVRWNKNEARGHSGGPGPLLFARTSG